eukprot:7910066-Alexandrium_andersonii.AAC.1
MSASLVGSEMCIRDSSSAAAAAERGVTAPVLAAVPELRAVEGAYGSRKNCLLYTSDAADDM